MRPLIGKPISTFTEIDWATFIATRRANRLITPGRPAKRKTVKALATAWGIEPTAILAAAKALGKGE